MGRGGGAESKETKRMTILGPQKCTKQEHYLLALHSRWTKEVSPGIIPPLTFQESPCIINALKGFSNFTLFIKQTHKSTLPRVQNTSMTELHM